MQLSTFISRYSLGAFLIVSFLSVSFVFPQEITLAITGASKKKDAHSSQEIYQLSLGERATIELVLPPRHSQQQLHIPGLDELSIGMQGTFKETRSNPQESYAIFKHTIEISGKKEGLITLGPVAIEHNGKTLRSNTLSLEITPPPTAQEVALKEQAVPYFSQLEISKNSIVMGESLSFVCRLYSLEPVTRMDIHPSDVTGLVIKQVEKAQRREVEINGINYHVIEVPYVLTPLVVGEHAIEPFMWSVFLPNQSRNDLRGLFSLFGGGYQEHRVASNKLIINVKELPSYAHHIDGIGVFDTFSLKVSQDKARVGDLISVTMILQGKGSLEQVSEPSLTLPDVFVSFDATKNIEVDSHGDGLSGRITFKHLIRASVSGSYEIAAQHMHFYDPDRQSYYKLSTEPITLIISGGIAGTHEGGGSPLVKTINNQSLEKNIIVNDIHFIKEQSLSSSCAHWQLPMWLFLVLLVFPLGWFFYGYIQKFIVRLPSFLYRKKECYTSVYVHKKVEEYASCNELEKFYALLKSFFSAEKKMPIECFSIEYVQDVLMKDGWHRDEIADFSNFLQQCAGFAFAPSLSQAIDTKLFIERAHFWIDRVAESNAASK